MPAVEERRLKRANNQPQSQQDTLSLAGTAYGPNVDSPLAAVAMRIRKAVSEGYNTGDGNFGGNYQRVPLPNHLSQPPSLSSSQSTRTVSNLEEWDSYYRIENAPIWTLDGHGKETSHLKRRYEDSPGGQPEIAQYQAKYGELHFNEEF
ncbi:uncharacterized protein LODBEIA_P49840 [Lodderomyces beijingensis]|uniref:Damage-regulated import facilitator 1 n=1 Tax=Lodderomyces beijingensis TaxID=1775926 RepID=A0ABP0ZU81_9ASCO